MTVRILLASALVAASVVPAAAQSVKVSFHGGKVDLSAENATVRAILNEWARVGGTRVVNAERLSGPPVTVDFKDAYEQVALEALLRGVAGYIVGPRPAGAPNASGFDRIVILATSNAPRPNPVTPVTSRPPGPQPLRRLSPPPEDDPTEVPDDNESAVNGPAPNRPETPADLRRRLGQLLEAEPNDDDAADDDADEPATPAPTPGNPFGVTTGAARPGVITPVPAARPAQPRQTSPASPTPAK
jgi:hypothetical protein